MFVLYADKVYLKLNEKEMLTSGSVNVYEVQFTFDSDWDGLDRMAVFRAGNKSRAVLLDETNRCMIPWEVLQTSRQTLYAGVYGSLNGETVLPTIWTSLGTIIPGTNTAELSAPPTPSIWDDLLQQVRTKADSIDVKDGYLRLLGEGEVLATVAFTGGGTGTGNVYSDDVTSIVVLDQVEYDALEIKSATTLYLIRG